MEATLVCGVQKDLLEGSFTLCLLSKTLVAGSSLLTMALLATASLPYLWYQESWVLTIEHASDPIR